MHEVINISLVSSVNNPPDVRWEMLKNCVVQESHSWSVNKAKQRKEKLNDIMGQLNNIKETVDLQNINVDNEMLQFEKVQKEYQTEMRYYTEGTMFRSKSRWYEFGEQNSQYFCKLEQINLIIK